jgi:hypothetical protein
MALAMPEKEPDSLLDLPLPDQGQASERSAIRTRTARPPRPARRALIVLFLLALAAVIGYFWPRAAPPLLQVDIDLLDLERQRVGTTSSGHSLLLRNAGSRSLLVSGIDIEGAQATDVEIAADGCTDLRRAAVLHSRRRR